MVRPTKLEAKRLECTIAPAPTYVLLAHARPHNALHSPSMAIFGASAASPVLARSMPTRNTTDRPVGRIAHAQKHAKHML